MGAIESIVALTVLVVVGLLANHYGRDGRTDLDPTFPGFVERPR